MKFIMTLLFTLALSLLLIGCSHYSIKKYSKHNILKSAKIALLPFSGDIHLRRSASEWFAFKIKDKIEQTLIPPVHVEMRLNKDKTLLTLDSKEIKPLLEDVVKIGSILDVNYAIIGDISIYEKSKGYFATLEISIIDIQAGSVFATLKQETVPNSEHYDDLNVIKDSIDAIVINVQKVLSSSRKKKTHDDNKRSQE